MSAKLARRLAFLLVFTVAYAIAFEHSRHNCQQMEAAGTSKTQGCINQGADCRVFGTEICWMQRHMSWKSEHEPHFVLIGKPTGTNVGVAWPPYLVVNSPDKTGHWRMFRIGFRYDRYWRGYIFPTIAAKHRDQPLRY